MPTESKVVRSNGSLENLPTLYPRDPPASFSSYEPKGRIIYLVECCADDCSTGIWKVQASKARELATSSFRLVGLKSPPEGMEEIAMLSRGQSYELPIVTRKGIKTTIRITHK